MQLTIIYVLNRLCLHLFILKYWQCKNQPFALTVFWYYSTNRMASQCTETIKSSLLYLYPNFPIALTGLVNLKLLIELLYIYWPSPPSFLHLTHVSNHWENSGWPEKKNCIKTKSNEVIDKTSGGPQAMTCNLGRISSASHWTLLGGPGGNGSNQICLPIICLISDEH